MVEYLENHDMASLKGKRVCFISPSAYPLLDASFGGGWSGGAEAQFVTIARKLSSAGLDVHFIVGDFGQEQKLVIDGLTVHCAAFRYMGGSKKYLIPDWIKLLRILRSIRADYHFIKVPRHLLLLLGIYCKLYGGKLVFVGQTDNDFDGNVVRSIDGASGWFLYRNGIRLTSAIIAQTEVQQKGFKNLFGKTSIVVRNVLTLEDDDVKKKDDYVLWVGNSSSNKQSELVPQLARMLPDVKFRMIMALSPGCTDDACIKEQLKELPNLDYIGSVPFSEISKHYKQARLFINTSKYEGFPNTFLQSWQYRTPVVSLFVDPDGVIERHNLGYLSHNIEKMLSHIQSLYNDPDLLKELGVNAYQYAYKYHSLESTVRSYLNLLVDLSKS